MDANLLDCSWIPNLWWHGLGTVLMVTLGSFLFHHYATPLELSRYNEAAGMRLGLLGPLLTTAMLFVISTSWLRYGNLQSVISDETVRLTLLGHAALTLVEPQRTQLVNATANYALSIASPEWQTMRTMGTRSAATSDALTVLTQSFVSAQAKTPRERLILRYSNRLVRELVEQREIRLSAVNYPLGKPAHLLLIIMVVAVLFLSSFFGLSHLSSKWVIASLFAACLSVPLTFNYVMLNVFEAPALLDSDSYTALAQTLRTALPAH